MVNDKSLSVEAKTTQPVQAGAVPLEPEFCRIGDLQRLFGIRRGIAFSLISTGAIRSVNLRKKGAAKGCRLIHVQSVRDYLKNLMPGDGQ